MVGGFWPVSIPKGVSEMKGDTPPAQTIIYVSSIAALLWVIIMQGMDSLSNGYANYMGWHSVRSGY